MARKQRKYEHPACRESWLEQKHLAQEIGVSIPTKMTAMPAAMGVYYVQGFDDNGAYIDACCAFSAKAKRITMLIVAAAPSTPRPLP